MSEISEPQLRAAHRQIDKVLSQPELSSWVEGFFDLNSHFEAGLMNQIPDPSPNEITIADLLAITALDVRVLPLGIREVLFDRKTKSEVSKQLSEIGPDEDIWLSSVDLGPHGPIGKLRDLLTHLDGVGKVTANKLLSRKRPRLIPIVDSVVMRQVQAPPETYWFVFQKYLESVSNRQRVEGLRPESVDADFPTLRLLDAAIWISGSGGRHAKKERSGGG